MDARHVATGSPCLPEGAARRPRLARRAALVLVMLAVATLALAARADAFVYWTNSDKIGRANLDGTGVDPSFITGAGNSEAVAVDGAHVYWINNSDDTIGRANLDGTGVDKSFIAVGLSSRLVGLAVDGEHLYWVSRFSFPETPAPVGHTPIAGPPNTGAIGRANLDGTGVDPSFINGISYPYGVAVDGAHVYWPSPQSIGRANLDGSGVNQSFLAGASAATGLAIDTAHVYWGIESANGAIGRANLDGTGVDPSFINGISPKGVAVDAAHVYWTDTDKQTIGRANLDGTGVDRNLIDARAYFDVTVDALSAPPSNKFRFGGVKVNKKRGSAKLTVNVPVGPGDLKLAKTGSVKGQRERIEPGEEKLTIKPRGKAKKRLNKRGKAKVKAKVTYMPDGGEANTDSKKIKLVKR